MTRSLPSLPSADMLGDNFSHSLCASQHASLSEYTPLVWRLGSSWATQCIRPIVIRFAPAYFQADDECLNQVAEYRRRREIVEAIEAMRTSYLRRGFWRHFGIGICGHKLQALFDQLAAEQRPNPSPRASAGAPLVLNTRRRFSRPAGREKYPPR